ncbi:MAG: polysaccharide lyase family 8 super-sandwich domain-containing protein [Mycoplasmoidaceae bacterium]
MKKIFLIPSLVVAAATPVAGLVSCSKDQTAPYPYEDILSSYKQMLIDTVKTTEYGQKTVQELRTFLITEDSGDGKISHFNNLNYEDPDRAIWPAHLHIVRALEIAIVADTTNDQAKMQIAIELVLYWLNHNYVNTNWWFNEIGVPRDLSNLALFVMDKLTSNQQTRLMDWIHHGSLKYAEATRSYTGTNTFWASDITMKSAALVKDANEMDIMFKYLAQEIKLDDNEGFQSDGTYFQHQHLLYTGGYGRQGALLLAKIASAFNDTDFKLNEKYLSIIVNFALDGMRYMTHKGNFTWQCMGRVYTRKKASDYGGGVTDLGNIEEMKYIANLPNCPRKDELNDLINKWETRDSTFSGIKYFPRSQFIACNFDGVYVGIKSSAPGLVNWEEGNGENQLAHNLAFGFNTSVMGTGQEYDDISPVWDYAYIPGTTTIDEDDEQMMLYDGSDDGKHWDHGPCYGGYIPEENVAFTSIDGTQKFRYGKGKGEYKGSVNYIITSFACNNGVAILATNIDNTTGENTLHTTVDQFVDDDGSIIQDERKTIVHGNVVYHNIEEGEQHQLQIETIDKTAKWSRNNESYGDETIDKRVSTITLNNPSSTSYAYSIQSADQHSKWEFKVVKNDSDAQVVLLEDDKIGCMFWNDSSFEYEGQRFSGKAGEFKIFKSEK